MSNHLFRARCSLDFSRRGEPVRFEDLGKVLEGTIEYLDGQKRYSLLTDGGVRYLAFHVVPNPGGKVHELAPAIRGQLITLVMEKPGHPFDTMYSRTTWSNGDHFVTSKLEETVVALTCRCARMIVKLAGPPSTPLETFARAERALIEARPELPLGVHRYLLDLRHHPDCPEAVAHQHLDRIAGVCRTARDLSWLDAYKLAVEKLS